MICGTVIMMIIGNYYRGNNLIWIPSVIAMLGAMMMTISHYYIKKMRKNNVAEEKNQIDKQCVSHDLIV